MDRTGLRFNLQYADWFHFLVLRASDRRDRFFWATTTFAAFVWVGSIRGVSSRTCQSMDGVLHAGCSAMRGWFTKIQQVGG